MKSVGISTEYKDKSSDTEEACGDSNNEFYEINSKRTTFAAVQSVMIGSVRANVTNIMCYKMTWYQKEFAIMYKPFCNFVCMDDKHKLKVGEPGYPVATVERGKQVIVAMGKKFEVADHDFTKFSITPSVNLFSEIPDEIEKTFYGGQVFVGVKEIAFQSSSPWRHATEMSKILKN
ncbi:unnamed protein product [Mytilus coruscus]|uniref:Uncharacterized protein n=1 Tax=Mytilus coruscus TaxID=42192 RepID=A0A6J8BAG2_MYTCO|nr:unnamed protein product [Mytilus coruscus]